ncbi:HAD-IA family hydrolase [Streptomyces sp. NPDC007872]|uniref:HAD-IA family hydrolase n=1 Tax=Streptomyces sp. NPDC007872 TaxID=3364782 RepID=UPI0036A0C7BE
MSLDLVVFDYSEVLSRNQPQPVVRALEEAAGVPPKAFWEAWHRHRPAYNTTASADEYWRLVADDLGAGWDAAHRQRLWSLDIGNCLNPHEPTVRVLRRLHGRVPLALLSDAPRDLARCLDGSPVMALFDRRFFSCDTGVNKPDPLAYETVLLRTGARPERTLFVDDNRNNTRGAERLGLQAHHYTTAEGLGHHLSAVYGL